MLEHPGNSKILGHNSREQWAHDIESSQWEQECTNTSTSFVHEIQVCYEAESCSFILPVISNNFPLSQWRTYERNSNTLQNPSSKSAWVSVGIYKPDTTSQTDHRAEDEHRSFPEDFCCRRNQETAKGDSEKWNCGEALVVFDDQ